MKAIIIFVTLLNFIFKIVTSLTLTANLKVQTKGNNPPRKMSIAESYLYRPKKEGHMEKVIREFEDIIFVPGDKPSGLPNAFVVSEAEAKGLNVN